MSDRVATGGNVARPDRNCWATPADVFAQLDAEFGPFDLDAAADASNAKCARFFDIEANGLLQPWFGRVFVNPPYSDIEPWVRKALDELAAGRASLVVMLLPDTREVGWFRLAKSRGAFDRPFAKRIQFVPPPGVAASSNRSGSVLLWFGCPICGRPLPRGRRGPPRVTCSDRCRMTLTRQKPRTVCSEFSRPPESPHASLPASPAQRG